MPAPVPRLPDGSILLHIGPHKTGTTAIQGALAGSRAEMAALDVSYTGRPAAHHAAARSLRRHPAGWAGDAEPVPDPRVWQRFARTLNRSPGRVVASSEFFAQCRAEERARVAADLDRERLHVLVAARNPGSIAISAWQQLLRNGTAGDLEEWLEQTFRRPAHEPATSGFWSWADTATLVDGWREVVDLDRIHVVVIDEADKTLLPSTFEQLLGLPEGLLGARTSLSGNRGLTASEAEVLRQGIALSRDQLTWTDFSQLFRTGFASHLLNNRTAPSDEARPRLPEWAAAQAADEARAIIERLGASGASVIGDLENLRAVPASGPAEPLTTVPTELAAHAVAGVVTGAVRGLESARREAAAATEAAAEASARATRATRRAKRARARQRGRGRTVGEVSTRELVTILRGRVLSGLRRRLPGGTRPQG